MESEEIKLFTSKVVNAIVKYYVKELSTEKSGWELYNVIHHCIASIGFVMAEQVNDKVIFHVLNPAHFIGIVDKKGNPVIWNFVQASIKKETGITIAVTKFNPGNITGGEVSVIDDALEYLESTWQMVYDKEMTFEQAFLK